MAIRSPVADVASIPRQRAPRQSALPPSDQSGSDASEKLPRHNNNRRKKYRKPVRSKRRTFIYHAKDPILHVEKMNRAKKPALYKHEIVTILGPFQSEYDAKLLKELWNYRSRSTLPRSFWAEMLARHFGLQICHDMRLVLPMRHFTVQHRGTQVFLVPK
jgi:hypothetical protein